MKDYIEREAAIAAAFSATSLRTSAFRDVYDTVNRLRLILTANVVEVRHGKWMKHGYACPCSECGWDIGFSGTPLELLIKQFNYCPKCGAKMTEV